MKVSFLGLGVMGYPMAGHLVKAGHEVTVYNRTTAKAEAWAKEHGGSFGATPKETVAGSEIVFCCVGNDDDLRSVVLGETGALAGMVSGGLFVDHTTASAEVARELFEVAKGKGVDFIDAPVSGGQAGAENGVLTVMCGGAQAPYDRAEPVIDAFARSCKLMGGSGAGQQTKMVNQIAIAGLLQGLSEADELRPESWFGYGIWFWKSSPKVPLVPGRWKIVAPPCAKTNLTSGLPLIGCARTCLSAWRRATKTMRVCL